MRKLAVLALSSMFLLSACDDGYDLVNRTIITDVKIKEIDSYTSGKTKHYTIKFKQGDSKKEQELEFDNVYASDLRDELNALNKTSAILESKEEVLFDLVLKGDEVIEVSLSKNRK